MIQLMQSDWVEYNPKWSGHLWCQKPKWYLAQISHFTDSFWTRLRRKEGNHLGKVTQKTTQDFSLLPPLKCDLGPICPCCFLPLSHHCRLVSLTITVFQELRKENSLSFTLELALSHNKYFPNSSREVMEEWTSPKSFIYFADLWKRSSCQGLMCNSFFAKGDTEFLPK